MSIVVVLPNAVGGRVRRFLLPLVQAEFRYEPMVNPPISISQMLQRNSIFLRNLAPTHFAPFFRLI